MKRIISLLLLLSITSCSGLVDRLHGDLDRDERRQSGRRAPKKDQFSQYRQDQEANNFRRNNQARVNSRNQKSLIPSIKRQYRPQSQARKRYTANDLNDNTSNGSLWAGKGKENYLFSMNKSKKNGDIILINIFNKLKNDISRELRKAYPSVKKKPEVAKTENKDLEAPKVAEAKPPVEKETQDEAVTGSNKIHDRISSIVIEEINKDHLLLRGQKYLLYKNRKRLIEVQALVARRDITEEDTVNSDTILESSVEVLR